MAVDMFLKVGDVKGESKDSQHKDWIEIESFSWGATQLGTSSHGSGAGGGKVSMNDFHFVMKSNSASPFLFLYCANGKHITGDTKLVCRKAGGKQEKFLEVVFNDVLISSYQTGGSSGGEIPMDQISLNYSKITIDYLVQDNQGKTQSAGKKHWDMKTNTGG